jgi:hypothetical protein
MKRRRDGGCQGEVWKGVGGNITMGFREPDIIASSTNNLVSSCSKRELSEH